MSKKKLSDSVRRHQRFCLCISCGGPEIGGGFRSAFDRKRCGQRPGSREFVRVARGKHRLPWEAVEAMRRAIIGRAESVASLTLPLHHHAMDLAERHTLPIYDTLIPATALDAGCDRLISEDFQHGRRFGRLEIVNPFRDKQA